MLHRLPSVRLFAILIAGIAIAVSADVRAQDLIERTELRRVMLTGAENTEVIVTHIVARPGAYMPLHTHPGDEFVFVLEGGTIQPKGQEPVALESGSTMHFPRDVVHGGFTVTGDADIVVVTTHVVDAGVPLMVLAE